MTIVGHLAEIYRYPVKSLRGERLGAAEVEPRGLVGDRLWAVRDADGKLGSGKNTRRMRRMDGLLQLAARYGEGGEVPLVAFPDGVELAGDGPAAAARLTALVGRPVELACEAAVPHFDAAPVHLVTTASLAHLGALLPGARADPRRFRPNFVLATPGLHGLVEDAWVGRRLRLGEEVELEVTGQTERCVMTTLPQADLPADGRILKALEAANDLAFGVYATVTRPGRVRAGDPVRLV